MCRPIHSKIDMRDQSYCGIHKNMLVLKKPFSCFPQISSMEWRKLFVGLYTTTLNHKKFSIFFFWIEKIEKPH